MEKFSLNSNSWRNWEGFAKEKCDGLTYLYDTLAFALNKAEEWHGPKVKVELYALTDGGNTTAGNKETVNENKDPNEVSVKYVQTSEWDNAEIARVYNNFSNDYREKIEKFIDGGIQWRWYGAGNPPKGIKNIRKDEYKLLLSSNYTSLKNPASVAEQKLPVSLVIPIPEEYEKDLPKVNADITLEVNGQKFTNEISLKPGKTNVSFQIPDKIGSEQVKGALSVENILFNWSRIELKPPTPFEFIFSAPDKLSFLSIEPKKNVYKKVGETVRFSAKASDGASVTWDIDGKPFKTDSFSHVFNKPGDYTATALAEKSGYEKNSFSVKIHVIDAGVEARIASPNPTVGNPISFEAIAKGNPVEFTWWIDKVHFSKQNNQIKTIIEHSGTHCVKVRAYYVDNIFAETSMEFEVEARPRLTIDLPSPDKEYDFGQEIKCRANIEGNFDKVIWEVKGPLANKAETFIDKEKHIATNYFNLAKGGQYTLSVTASGSAGTITSNVNFKVKNDNPISIVSPDSNDYIKLGTPIDLVARVTDDRIKQIKWTIINNKTGKESHISDIPSKVIDKKAKCKFTGDESIGAGVKLFIKAEAIYDPPLSGEAAGSSTVDQIELNTLLDARIDIKVLVDGEETFNGRAKFNQDVDLVADCRGCVDKNTVEWFVRGNDQPIGKSTKCPAPKVKSIDGRRFVSYYAKAKLPDGSFKQSEDFIVSYSCGCKEPKIEFPKNEDQSPKTIIGLKERFTPWIESGDTKLIDIVWDMGDGTTINDTIVNHQYKEYGTYTVTVAGKCKDCGRPYNISPVQIKVEKQHPKASFEVEEKGTYYSVLGKIHLHSTSTGDIENYIWTVDGKGLTEYSGKPEAEIDLPKTPCDIRVKLKVIGPQGEDQSETDERALRIRYGWWAIILFFVVAIIIVVLAWRVFLHNELLGLTVHTHVGSAPCESYKQKLDEVEGFSIDGYKIGKEIKLLKILSFLCSREKNLLIKISDLTQEDSYDGERYNPNERFGDRCFTFLFEDNAPCLRYDDDRFVYESPFVWRERSPMEEDANEPNTRIVVLRDKFERNPELSYIYVLMRPGTSFLLFLLTLTFWSILIILIYLVFYFSVTYAI